MNTSPATSLTPANHGLVLVYAGPEHPPALRSFPPRYREPGHRLLFVDFADDFDERARAAVQHRQRAYAGRGFVTVRTP